MKKLKMDWGLESYRLGEFGVVKFNPADPALYSRFLQAQEKVAAMEQVLSGAETQTPEQVLALLQDTDYQLKALLSWVFGPPNDFAAIFQSTNLMAPDSKGVPLVAAVMEVLAEPIRQGLSRWTREQVAQAKEKAAARRQAQC